LVFNHKYSKMRKHYPFFVLSVVFALCGPVLFAQEGGQMEGQTVAQTGLQAYKAPLRWRVRGLDLSSFFGTQNTATGTGALTACTSCYENVADGYQVMNALTTGNSNTGVGFQALALVTTGGSNTAIGWAALNITNSTGNTAVGAAAMESNTSGSNNTGVGANALGSSTGSNDVAIGAEAFSNAFSESYSTMVGAGAGSHSESSSGYNTAIGYNTLFGAGHSMGGPVSTGSYNLVAGANAMYYNTTGSYNDAAGFYSLYANTSGSFNANNGAFSEYQNTSGQGNVADGFFGLFENTSGNYNTAVGFQTLMSNTTGSNNTVVGANAEVNTGALSNATALGAGATVSSSNAVMVGNSSVTSIGGYANWTNFSDGRYKKNIQSNVPGLAFINKLTPVTYTLDIDGIETVLHKGQSTGSSVAGGPASLSSVIGGLGNPANDPVMKQAQQDKSAITYTGFVAQDVEKAADSLNFSFSGIDKPKDANQNFYGLRYGDFVPPLVKAVQELSKSSDSKDSAISAVITAEDSLRMQMVGLRAQVAELRAMILAQKSSASLDQNAPNPFTGSTVIGYTLPLGVTSAQMQISDIDGKVMAVIPLTGSGRSSITADVAGYAAGTYTYSLMVNGRIVSTKKMVSVR
jgi:hypothetical protein